MGAEASVGRDEIRLWGASLTLMDEPLCWLPVQATASPAQEGWLGVLGVSLPVGCDLPVDLASSALQAL